MTSQDIISNALSQLLADGLKSKITVEGGLCEHKNRLDILDNIKPSTRQRSYSPAYNELKKFFGPDYLLLSVTQKDAEKFLSKFNQHKHYKRLMHSVSTKIFKDFVEMGYRITNPFEKIPKAKPAKSEIVVIADCDTERIIGGADTHFKDNKNKKLFTSFIRLLAGSGLRPGEALSLRKKNLMCDDEKDITIISIGDKHFTSKTGCSRLVPVTGEAHRLLYDLYKSAKNSDVYLFGGNKKPRTVDSFSKSFKAICRKLELPESYKLYALRASYASKLINAGIQIQKISKLLGHSEISTTQKYYSRFDTINFNDVLDVLRNSNNVLQNNLKESA